MNGYELLRILYGLFLGIFLIIAGVLTFTSKGEPGIGFRIGYTYLSERARRKANRVSGIGTILTGLALVILSPFFPMPWLMAVVALGLGVTVLLAYLVAKREYELEELSKEASEKPGRRIEPPRVGKYLILQLMFAGVSFTLILTGEVPRDPGILLVASIQLFLLALTVLVSRPLVFQLAPKFKGKMALGFARAMTVVSAMVALQLAVAALKPGTSPLLVVLMLLVSLGAVFYAAFVSLTSAYEEGYY
ncbi:SdpI family protein [Thermococcus sp. 9N3]|uniref:SdpI family protein n=1 Tax=Thermococcus sp. 9N3 TaxID=163002 RepID=UPI00197E1FE2|nr:SdpI family protein [Thermococcus sp. 9N3]